MNPIPAAGAIELYVAKYSVPLIEYLTMNQQQELPLETPPIDGYLVELRKGQLGDLHTERSVHADSVDGVANIVEGFRTHAVQADSVRWESDRISVGSCRGLAPLGVVYEIAVTPAITLDA